MDIPLKEQESILEYLVNQGTINIGQIQEELAMKKRKDLLDKHPFEIWQGKDGYWRTYLYDSSHPQKRKLVKRKNLRSLEDAIIESESIESLEDIFDEVLERKLQNADIKPATYSRYRQVFARHFKATGWDAKDIREITVEQFTDFIEDEVGRCQLDSKGLSNLKGIVKLILKRAKRRHLIDFTYSTVFDDLDVRTTKKVHTAEDQIFTVKELPELIRYLSAPENRTVHHLVLLFMVLSGIRVGEAVALSFDDFINDTAAVIHRTETKYKVDGKYHYELSDAPKTQAGFRTVFIPQEYTWVVKELRKLRPFAEFLATNEHGERMTTNCLRQRLYRVCNKLHFENRKSTHKLRKTFCSIVLDAGFDQNLITAVMGHTDIRTSESFYHYDRKTDEMKQNMMDNIAEFKQSSNY